VVGQYLSNTVHLGTNGLDLQGFSCFDCLQT
jgi:hypothetical protein